MGIAKFVHYREFCSAFNRADHRNHVAFAFVRDPVERFISGYAETEGRVRNGVPAYRAMSAMLGRFPVGSPERAAAFFQAFLGHKTTIDPMCNHKWSI